MPAKTAKTAKSAAAKARKVAPWDRRTQNGQTSEDVEAKVRRFAVLDVVEAAAAESGVTVGEICSSSQSHRVSRARCLAWVKLRARGWSLMEIAALWDRDHSTVVHGIRRAVERGGYQGSRPRTEGECERERANKQAHREMLVQERKEREGC